jgi:hypothetical protein
MSPRGDVTTNAFPALEDQLARISRQLEEITDLTLRQREPSLKNCLTVEELAERWALCPEAVRRLIREKKLKPLRGFRPFRITLDEIRRYEALEEGREARALARGSLRARH